MMTGNEHTQDSTTVETAILGLWRNCLSSCDLVGEMEYAAGVTSSVVPDAVQRLIAVSRALIANEGHSKRDSDCIMFAVYTTVHWDYPGPIFRLVETLLEFELAEFFGERLVH